MKQIFRIFTLIAVAMLTAGQAWAETDEFGKIIYTQSDGGTLEFYEDLACEDEITLTNGKSSALTVGTVYIKAMADGIHSAANVTFTAQVSISSSSLEARAITRGTEIGIGDAITVSPVSGKPGIYSFTMPTDGKNVTVSATFKEKPYLGDGTNAHISYYSYDAQGNRVTSNTGDDGHPRVYILDGTEASLGQNGTDPATSKPYETWYVCNSTTGLSYTWSLTLYGTVHLILADNAKMTMDVNCPAIFGHSGDFYIYGQSDGDNIGKLIATSSDETGITINGKLYVNGGQVEAIGSLEGISCKGATINGGQVTAIGNNGIIANNNVTISGGQVTATGSGTNGCGIISLRGGVTISGGQVTATGDTKGIYTTEDIILGWTNASDYIKVSKYDGTGSVKTIEGQRFVAYNMTSETDISATTIVSGSIANNNFTLADIDGKTLKPIDGYTVTVADGISVGTLSGTTFTAADPDFTITTGAGTENEVTTPYYIYKASTEQNPVTVTLRATENNKKLTSVTITGATATKGDGTFTFEMGTSDVTVTDPTFVSLVEVSYSDPTAEGNDKTKKVFATPLTGSESTLGADNTDVWYVVSDDVSYNTAHQGDIYILDVKGNVNIILADGKTMTIGGAANDKNGFYIREGAKLTIYGQGGSTEGSLTINSGNAWSVEANGSNEVIICGGNVTTDHGIANYQNGKFTIHGGSFKDTRENTSESAINAGAITINGGTVSTANMLSISEYATGEGFGDITINGGKVSVNKLRALAGNAIINGGQVTLTEPNAANYAIDSKENITLGWTNATDFIEATGTYSCGENGTLSIAEGQALMATGNDANVFSGTIDKENGIYPSYPINGKTLKPALKINLPTNVTATGTNVVTSETAGTYAIYDTTVKLSGTAPAGQILTGFSVKDADKGNVAITVDNEFTMPAMAVTVTANLTNIPATAPTISTQPSNLNLEWGYNSGNVLTVSASAATSHVLSYQWYSNSSNSTTGGSAISNATSNSYTVPTGKNAGTTEYYYCVVTAKRSDNNETAPATSNVATVTVEAKDVTYSGGTITQDQNGYTVNLTEGTGSANPLPDDADLYKLTYSRTLTAPGSGKGDVTIGGQAAKLYTVCLPFTPETDNSVKYYTLSSVSGQTVSFEEVTTPAANTPYLVAVTVSTNITESCTSEVVTSTTINSTTKDGYTFTGTFTGLEHAQAVGKHILQSENKWCVVESGSVFIPPFRAYIESASGARELTGSFDDDATGIQNILTVDRDGTERWYDLNGRRIDQPAKKGIYINNGKKVIKK